MADDGRMPHWGQYEWLRPAQVVGIRASSSIAYLPWGALEWHSYHNPIGLDGMKAHRLCLALAQWTGGVVLPPLYLGTDTIKPFKGFPHTLDHPASTVMEVCTQFLMQLAEEGFRVMVVLTGHYSQGHLAALSTATEAFAAQHPAYRVWLLPDSVPLAGHYAPDHAGRTETSWQLWADPALVDLARCPPERDMTLDDDGVTGDDPRLATAVQGEAMLAVFLDQTVPHIQHLLAEVST